jgi:hypothetical protein
MRFYGIQVHYGPERPCDVRMAVDTFLRTEEEAREVAKNLSKQIAGDVLIWPLDFFEAGLRACPCYLGYYKEGLPRG